METLTGIPIIDIAIRLFTSFVTSSIILFTISQFLMSKHSPVRLLILCLMGIKPEWLDSMMEKHKEELHK